METPPMPASRIADGSGTRVISSKVIEKSFDLGKNWKDKVPYESKPIPPEILDNG